MSHTELIKSSYRRDIDGLRGFQILALMAFHAFPNQVTGGYIGVSIFFVISGYLISTIILNSLEKGSFNFVEFYIRRIRRIFPALIVILIAAFTIGWFYLIADDFNKVSKFIAGGAVFIDNFIAWQESGYFDSSAELKPLLHLWSLGIEEQFYLFWPVFLWVAWKTKLNLFVAITLICFGSFALNIANIVYDPVATFYAPWCRFWEILSGGILAYLHLYPNKFYRILPFKFVIPLSNTCSILGLFILIYGILFFTKKTPFPGWYALAPIIGALLLIGSGENSWANKWILSNRVIIWLGFISYPLYLWHWMLLAYSRFLLGEEPRVRYKLGLLTLAIVLSWLTYKFIENPIRFGGWRKIKSASLIVLLAIIGFSGSYTYEMKGLPFRKINHNINDYQESILKPVKTSECSDIVYAYKKDADWFCGLGANASSSNFFVYGDSHALGLLSALDELGLNQNEKFYFSALGSCPPLLNIEPVINNRYKDLHNCKVLNNKIFEFVINSGIKNVILAGHWTLYIENLSGKSSFTRLIGSDINAKNSNISKSNLQFSFNYTVNKYKEKGVNVFVMNDTPHQLTHPTLVMNRIRSKDLPSYDWSINKNSISLQEHLDMQNEINKFIDSLNIVVLNLDSELCQNNICPLMDNKKFLYFDDNHLSHDGSLRLLPKLQSILEKYI